jgi:hypothetical protein
MNVDLAIAALNELKGHTVINRVMGVFGKIHNIQLCSDYDMIIIVCKVNRNGFDDEDIKYWTQQITISFLQTINNPAQLFKLVFIDNEILDRPLYKLCL